MLSFKRSQRVAALLREEISQIITTELKDPQIGLATVTHIKITDDLKSARVYVSILGDKETRNRSMAVLEKATNWIRSELGHRTHLKYVPKLVFCYDDTEDYAENIESIIKKLKHPDAGA
ncbi:MAG: 30S ribosome-binding factor RbfA [Calditrichaeota bacterium]|nr:MAG: 30S ribosome-binding factor RbfA [Calditrichota bacterium]